MSAVKRRLFNALAAMSLALCLTILALWIRSQFVSDSMSRETWDVAAGELADWGVLVSQGQIELGRSVERAPPGSFVFMYRYRPGLKHGGEWWALPIHHSGTFWLKYERPYTLPLSSTLNGTMAEWSVGCRLWVLALAFALLPARWALSRRRPQPGCCGVCGYDLRATPDRCPECGTTPPARATRARAVQSAE
jgi:hypothetical protein